MEFKDRIKALRVERNMTQSQVAAMLGKSEGAVRAWEIERSKPDIDTLIILADYFKCTTDYLLGLSDYRNSEEKKEIESLSKDLDEVIAKIDNGRGLLEDLVQFLNLVLKRDQQFIATAYLVIARYFTFSLNELYKLQDEFTNTKTFDSARFFECYLNISTTTTVAKKNVQLISSYPLPWITHLATEYGSETDKLLAKKFFSAYHNKGFENTTDIWGSAMDAMKEV